MKMKTKFIFTKAQKKGHKIDSIINNDKVCFTTWNDGYVDDGDWAYQCFKLCGEARLVEDCKTTEEKVEKLHLNIIRQRRRLKKRNRKGLKAYQLIEIEIEHISGKKVHENNNKLYLERQLPIYRSEP